jgi:hypothetical protein
MVTPTVELNALAMKRGERTVYVLENGSPAHAPQVSTTKTLVLITYYLYLYP